jgi:hypothetical protein
MKIVVPSGERIVGAAVQNPENAPQQIFAEVLTHLDQGEGWVQQTESEAVWTFGRLSAHVRLILRDYEYILRCDITLVTEIRELSPELLSRMNDLNSHAYGWLIWYDPTKKTIVSTYAAAASRSNWWWTWFTLETIPIQATVAESVSDELARLVGGSVAVTTHPARGLRTGVDGWVIAGRMGSREPVASLGHFVTLLDAILIKEAYGIVRPPIDLEFWGNLAAHEVDEDGWTTVRMASHWHPEYGWCWQHAKVAGFTQDSAAMSNEMMEEASSDVALLRLAAEMNSDTGAELLSWPIIGGWVVADYIGLAHVSHLNGSAIENIAVDAHAGFGTSMGISLGQLSQSSNEPDDTTLIAGSVDNHNSTAREVLRTLQNRTGPIGHSYRLPEGYQPSPSIGTFSDSPENWLMPKHLPLANFGIFNPAGPTVGSLEVGFRGDQQDLYLVMRHPFSAECIHMASADLLLGPAAFSDLIRDWLAGLEWSPLDWVTVVDESIAEAVSEGLRGYASAFHHDVLHEHLTQLIRDKDAWLRVLTKREIEYDLGDVGDWVQLVSKESNGWEYQVFIRSAWEGAKIFGDGGAAGLAEVTADFFRRAVMKRCLEDLEVARGGEGPPIAPFGYELGA